MHLNPGTILISAPSLDDPNFIKAVILVTEYNQQGAIGFVLNEPFDRKLNELVEFQQSKSFDLYTGGPMEQEKLFVLHRRPAMIEQSDLVADGVYTCGDFKQVLAYINRHAHAEKDIKLLLGYCGWDAGQLEEEIAEDSWLMVQVPLSFVFEENAGMLWEKLYNHTL